MKITLAIATIAVVGASSHASVADIRVTGAKDTVAMRGAIADTKAMSDNMAKPTGADLKVKIATADILNKPTALMNKNTLAMDNNVFVSRSNIMFSQNDRLALADALAKKVETIVTSASALSPTAEAHAADMDTDNTDTSAVLTKSVLRAVSGSDTDTALMTKASAVVAAKDDASMRGQRIGDLVRAALDAKMMQSEQAIQSDTPRGVIIMADTKDILRQPTAAVNKNVAVTDTQVAVARSTIAPSQNGNIMLTSGAKVANAVLPASAINTESADADNYRVAFLYGKNEASDAAATTAGETVDARGDASSKEQLWAGGFGYGGLGCGWRYPLGYWNLYGAGLYGGGCGLGLAYGPYYYC